MQAEPPEPEPVWEEQPQAVPQYTLHHDETSKGLPQDVRRSLCNDLRVMRVYNGRVVSPAVLTRGAHAWM